MGEGINPAAALPATQQAFIESDRNSAVNYLGREEADGGLLPSPGREDGRATPAAPAVSPDAGLKY